MISEFELKQTRSISSLLHVSKFYNKISLLRITYDSDRKRMSKLQHTELVMRYIIINIDILKYDFSNTIHRYSETVYVSIVGFVGISWCSISDYREQHEHFVCDLHCSL